MKLLLLYSFVPRTSSIIPSRDLTILKCEVPQRSTIATHGWLQDPLPILHDVATVGFPHSLSHDPKELIVRGFKGHVIGQGFYRSFPDRPRYYELSFLCPPGIPGAPLLIRSGETWVAGIIIGDLMTDVTISSLTEISIEHDKESHYEKTETLHRGIALASVAFLSIESSLLKGQLDSFLSKQRLLKQSTRGNSV